MKQTNNEPLITISEAARQIGMDIAGLWRQVKAGGVRSHPGVRIRKGELERMVLLSEVVADRASNVNSNKARGRKRPEVQAERAAKYRASKLVSKPATKSDPVAAPVMKTEPAKQKFTTDLDPASFAAAQARRENTVAEMKSLELEQKRGNLIAKAEAYKLLFDAARQNRDSWLSWPSRVAELLAAQIVIDPATGAVDARMLGATLNDFVRDHLAELARGFGYDEQAAA